MPDPYLPTGLWGDEYRDAGGIVVPDFLAEQQRQEEARVSAYEASQLAEQARAEAEVNAAQEAQWAQAAAEFTDWPTYQKLVVGKTPPHQAYEDYIASVLPWQLKNMGYSDEEAQAEVEHFAKLVSRPDADYGFFGNLWESLKGGVKSGTRAEQATGNLVTGDLDALARGVVEQSTAEGPVGPLKKFQEQFSTDAAKGDLWEAIKAFAGASVDQPQGGVLFLAEQLAQSYPALAAGLAGMGVGALGGPVGMVAGGAAGTFAGSASLEVGSGILERIAEEAQRRNIDPRNGAAIVEMIRDPMVYASLRDAAVAKGLTVGAADAAVSTFTLGIGKYAAGAARAGRGLRATGAAAGGVGVESVGGAAGEALSQAVAGDQFDYSQIVAEGFGELGPGAAHVAMGALIPGRSQQQPGVVPPVTPPVDELDEGGLGINMTEPPEPPPGAPFNVIRGRAPPSFEVGEGESIDIPPVGPVEPLGVGSTNLAVTEPTIEEITLLPAQFIDSAEQRIADGRLLEYRPNAPLAVTPEGVVATPEQLDARRVAEAATPQAVDLNIKDPENVVAWLQDRGVDLLPSQTAIIEDLVGTPPRQRRAYIADTIENLVASPDANAETLAQGLLAIERTLPKDPVPKAAEAAAALARDMDVPTNQVLSALSSVAAQDVMTAISAGVTNATEATGSTTPTQTAATPVKVKRGLKPGEPIPVPSLSTLANQLTGTGARSYESTGGAGQAQASKPRSGLRPRVAQEGAARSQPVGGTTRRGFDAGATSNRIEPVDTSGVEGVPRLVRGTQYGSQPVDVANKEAVAAERTATRAKKEVKGLRKRGIDVVTMTAEEYEKTYPGRKYQDDLDDIVDMPVGRTDNQGFITPAQQQSLSGSTDSALEYLSAVMESPLARLVAKDIRALGLQLPPVRFDPTLPQGGVYRLSRSRREGHIVGTNRSIIMNPTASSLESVLHEFVHAATMKELTEPSSQHSIDVRNKLEALRQYVQKTIPDLNHTDTGYGLTNVYEFVSEVMTNERLQNVLRRMKLPGTGRTLWQSFKQLVFDILGITKSDSVLSEALLASRDLFSGEQIGIAGFSRRIGEVRAERTPSKADQIRFDTPAAAKGVAAPSTAILGVKNGTRTFIAYPKDKNDPNTLYTLYRTASDMRGDPESKVRALSRQQVEQMLQADGSEFIPPLTDSRPAPGTPKNTDKKRVGFSNEGDLKAAAFEQKDGTWTYYQSDVDVRTDPDAKVSKGLTRDQVERYITQAGYLSEAPQSAAVKPDGDSPTAIGYTPASKKRFTFQDFTADLKKIGDVQSAAGHDPTKNVGYLVTLNNSRVANMTRRMHNQYVKPAIAAGKRVAQAYGKSDAEILDVVKNLHVAERMPVKIQQILRGNKDPVAQAAALTDLKGKQNAAEAAVASVRASNPAYVRMIEQELAPKLKAMSDATLDMQAQYGLLTREAVEAMKNSYNFYLPLQHGDRTTTGKAATGASVTTNEPFARMVEQMDSTIVRGERNRWVSALADLAKGGIINKETGKPAVLLGSDVVTTYDEKTNSLNDTLDAHAFDPNTVPYYVGGKRHTMTVVDTPSLSAALKPFVGKDRETVMAAIVGLMAWTNRLIAVGKTTLSPLFAPFNFFRDIQTANVNLLPGVSRVKFNGELLNPATYGAVAWNVMREAFGGEPVGGYAAAREAGSFIDHRSFVNLDPISHDLDMMFKPSGLKGLNARRKRLQGGAFDMLSIISQISESVPRYAMYKAAKSSAIANGMAPKAAEMFAANAAKTSSVNFEQRGLHNLSNYWIFGNAKVQGITALIDSAKRQGVLKTTLGSMGLISLGMIAAALGYEWSEKDKDGKSKYTKIPNYKKDSMILFKEGALGVPISQEISPLYVLGNALMEYKAGGTTPGEAASRIMTSFMNNLWPGNVPQQEVAGHKANVAEFIARAMVPSATAPILDLTTNKNTFGSEVVPGLGDKLKKGIPKHEMGSATENQLAVNAAKGLHSTTGIDMAPQQLKLINNYFNPASEGYAFIRDLFGGREPKYEGDIVNPFERRFTGVATGFYDQEQFDELRSKAARAKYLAEKDGISNLTPEDQALARSAQMLEKVNSDANNLFKGSKLLTQERRTLLNERKRELILDGIRRYNELRDRTVSK